MELVKGSRNRIERAWHEFFRRAASILLDETSMWVGLSDGRVLGVPLAWFPRLVHGTDEERLQVQISARELHWESLDEDTSIAGLLAGLPDQSLRQSTIAS